MRLVIDFAKGAGAAPPELIAALEAEQARNHELVEHLKAAEVALQQGQEALAHQNELLRTRTIERDHAAEDGHLWSLCLAYLVSEGEVESLPGDAVNAMTGQMLSALVADGQVYLTVQPRPEPSQEGRDG